MTSMNVSAASPRMSTGLSGDDASPVLVSNRTPGRLRSVLSRTNRAGIPEPSARTPFVAETSRP